MKDYLDKILHLTTDNILEADAVEYAILFNWIKLTYQLNVDVAAILHVKEDIVEHFRREAERAEILTPLLELTQFAEV